MLAEFSIYYSCIGVGRWQLLSDFSFRTCQQNYTVRNGEGNDIYNIASKYRPIRLNITVFSCSFKTLKQALRYSHFNEGEWVMDNVCPHETCVIEALVTSLINTKYHSFSYSSYSFCIYASNLKEYITSNSLLAKLSADRIINTILFGPMSIKLRWSHRFLSGPVFMTGLIVFTVKILNSCVKVETITILKP